MVQFRLVWSFMVPYGPVWFPYGPVCSRMVDGALWSRMVQFRLVWSFMVPYGPVLFSYGPVCSRIFLYGPVLSYMVATRFCLTLSLVSYGLIYACMVLFFHIWYFLVT